MTPRRNTIHEAIDLDLDHLAMTSDQRRTIHAVIDTELDHPSALDGHATNRRLAPGARSTAGISSTERTATQLIDTRQRDEYREHVTNLIQYIKDAAASKRAAETRLKAILGIVKPLIREDENDQWCAMMYRVTDSRGLPVKEAVTKRIIEQGVTLPLSEWAYNFRTRNGRLPTVDECAQHHKGGRVMIKKDVA